MPKTLELASMREKLREQVPQNGRPWTHPRTLLEYEDFAAFLEGKDPLAHWRNDRIEAYARRKDRLDPEAEATGILALFNAYDLAGNPNWRVSVEGLGLVCYPATY